MSSSDSKSAFNRLFFLYFSDVSHHVFLWLYKIYFSLRLTLCWGGRSAMLRADPRSVIIISSPGKQPSLKYTRLGHLSSSFHQCSSVQNPSVMNTKVGRWAAFFANCAQALIWVNCKICHQHFISNFIQKINLRSILCHYHFIISLLYSKVVISSSVLCTQK